MSRRVEVRDWRDLAGVIEHTLLDPSADEAAVDRLCDEAIKYSFYAVCVNPYYVPRAARRLRGTGVKVVSVVAFPFGATYPEVKAMEASMAMEAGAEEVDVVMNISAAKSGRWDVVRDDVARVAEAVRARGGRLKVILEVGYLTDEEKVAAARAAMEGGADFVKTSTGYGKGGATARDVELLARAVEGRLGVKAAGGIRTAEQALAMLAAGATRIGSSHGVDIVESFVRRRISF